MKCAAWACDGFDADGWISTHVSAALCQNIPAVPCELFSNRPSQNRIAKKHVLAYPWPYNTGTAPYSPMPLPVMWKGVSRLYSRYGSTFTPMVVLNPKSSACSGIPKRIFAKGNVKSRAMASGPFGLLSTKPLYSSSQVPSYIGDWQLQIKQFILWLHCKPFYTADTYRSVNRKIRFGTLGRLCSVLVLTVLELV